MHRNKIDIIADLLGYIGRGLVLIGMLCGCILAWYIIINHIIIK
jgi:hypothetical protein